MSPKFAAGCYVLALLAALPGLPAAAKLPAAEAGDCDGCLRRTRGTEVAQQAETDPEKELRDEMELRAKQKKKLEDFVKKGAGGIPPSSFQASTPDEKLAADKKKALEKLDKQIELDTLKGLTPSK